MRNNVRRSLIGGAVQETTQTLSAGVVRVSDLLAWVSLVVGVVSVFLGIFAVWLSVKFYRWSDTSSTRIQHAAGDIESSVGELRSLFEHMYKDVFDLLRSSYRDISEHAWGDTAAQVEARAEQKAEELLQQRMREVEAKMTAAIENLEVEPAKRPQVESIVRDAVETASSETRELDEQGYAGRVEARLLGYLSGAYEAGERVTLDELTSSIRPATPVRDSQMVLRSLKKRGLVDYGGTTLRSRVWLTEAGAEYIRREYDVPVAEPDLGAGAGSAAPA